MTTETASDRSSAGAWSALVTGGSSGIGAALVEELVSRGGRVYSVARSEEKLHQQARRLGPRLVPIVADISRPQDRLDIASQVTAPLDFLIHNAGILDPVGPVEELSLSGFRQNFTTNTEAVLFLTQALLDKLRQPGARVLAVSSGAAFRAIPGWAAYCTAKAAMNRVIQVFNAEWKSSRGIYSALVRPGVVDTPMQAHIRSLDSGRFPAVEQFRQLKAENRLAQAEEVARFMADILLCSSDEDFSQILWDYYEKSELAHKMADCARKTP